MRKLSRLLIYGLVFFNLVGCAQREQQGGVDSLAGLQNLSVYNTPKPFGDGAGGSEIRKTGLEETALSLGAQSGLAYRSKQINHLLKTKSDYLDAIFNFNSLLLEHNVLPPVLAEGRNTLHKPNAMVLRMADRSYQIQRQARFVTTPPHWREYLWLNYSEPELPHFTLLPKNPYEREIWNQYVTQGWERGIRQANRIFYDNLALMKHEFQGMVLYRILLAKKMVSPPFVARTELGVTGDGNAMRVNDQTLRITALPNLQPKTDTWRALVSQDER